MRELALSLGGGARRTDRRPSPLFIHACDDSLRLASWDLYWHHPRAEDCTVYYLSYVRIIGCWCIAISLGTAAAYCGQIQLEDG
jgi:hypothetical protein